MLSALKNLRLSKVDKKLQELSRHEKFLGLVSGVINTDLWIQKNSDYFWDQLFSGFNIASASKLKDLYQELYRLERANEYYEDRVEALELKLAELQGELSKKSQVVART